MAGQEGLEISFVSCPFEYRLKLFDVICIETIPVDFVLSEFGRRVSAAVRPSGSRELVCGKYHV